MWPAETGRVNCLTVVTRLISHTKSWARKRCRERRINELWSERIFAWFFQEGRCSDALWVSLTGRHIDIDGGAYCGTGPFTVISEGPSINSVLRSTETSRGGRFRCTVAAAPAGSNVTLTRPPPAPSPPHARPPSEPKPGPVQPPLIQPPPPTRPTVPPQTTPRPPYQPLPAPSRPPVQPGPPTNTRPEDLRCDCGVSVSPARVSFFRRLLLSSEASMRSLLYLSQEVRYRYSILSISSFLKWQRNPIIFSLIWRV